MNLVNALELLRRRVANVPISQAEFTGAVQVVRAEVERLARRVVWPNYLSSVLADVITLATQKLVQKQPTRGLIASNAEQTCRDYVRKVVKSKFYDWLRKNDDGYREKLAAQRDEKRRERDAARPHKPTIAKPIAPKMAMDEILAARSLIQDKVLPRIGRQKGQPVESAMQQSLDEMEQLGIGQIDVADIVGCDAQSADFLGLRAALYQRHNRTRMRIALEAARMAQTQILHGRPQMLMAAEDCASIQLWMHILKRRRV